MLQLFLMLLHLLFKIFDGARCIRISDDSSYTKEQGILVDRIYHLPMCACEISRKGSSVLVYVADLRQHLDANYGLILWR